MSEITETYKAYREFNQQRRRNNKEKSTHILQVNEVQFESKNGGSHLIVNCGDQLIDYWPGTGLWIPRNSGERHRGVFNLLKYLGIEQPKGFGG